MIHKKDTQEKAQYLPSKKAYALVWRARQAYPSLKAKLRIERAAPTPTLGGSLGRGEGISRRSHWQSRDAVPAHARGLQGLVGAAETHGGGAPGPPTREAGRVSRGRPASVRPALSAPPAPICPGVGDRRPRAPARGFRGAKARPTLSPGATLPRSRAPPLPEPLPLALPRGRRESVGPKATSEPQCQQPRVAAS